MSRSEIYRKLNEVSAIIPNLPRVEWRTSTRESLEYYFDRVLQKLRQNSRDYETPANDIDQIARNFMNPKFLQMVRIEKKYNLESNISANNRDSVFIARLQEIINILRSKIVKSNNLLEFIDTRVASVDDKLRLKDSHLNVESLNNNDFFTLYEITGKITANKLREEVNNFGSIKFNIGAKMLMEKSVINADGTSDSTEIVINRNY